MRTWNAKKDEVKRNWLLIDAKDQILGRLSTKVAMILRGKTKPQFTPHIDTGDFVVVINADKVKMTGKKWESKKYYRRSRWFGSVREQSAKEMLTTEPEFVIKDAVKGMLPKNRLSRQLIKKLKIYSGSDHPHAAQKPETLIIK